MDRERTGSRADAVAPPAAGCIGGLDDGWGDACQPPAASPDRFWWLVLLLGRPPATSPGRVRRLAPSPHRPPAASQDRAMPGRQPLRRTESAVGHIARPAAGCLSEPSRAVGCVASSAAAASPDRFCSSVLSLGRCRPLRRAEVGRLLALPRRLSTPSPDWSPGTSRVRRVASGGWYCCVAGWRRVCLACSGRGSRRRFAADLAVICRDPSGQPTITPGRHRARNARRPPATAGGRRGWFLVRTSSRLRRSWAGTAVPAVRSPAGCSPTRCSWSGRRR